MKLKLPITNSTHSKNRIGRRMSVLIVGASAVIMLVISVVQLVFEYRDLRTGLDRHLDGIEIYVQSIARSVWSFDDKQIQLSLNGLAKLPDIAQTQVVTTDNEQSIWQAGTSIVPRRNVTRNFPLYASVRGQTLQIGELRVIADLAALDLQIMRRGITIVITNMVKTMLVVWFMLFLFRRKVTERIERMGVQVKLIKSRLFLSRVANETDDAEFFSNASGDELDSLAWTLEHTVTELEELSRERDDTEKTLIESEKRYRSLFQNNPQPMWVQDAQTHAFLAVNDAAVLTYGFSETEFLSMSLTDLNIQKNTQPLNDDFKVIRGGKQEPIEHRRNKKTPILVELSSHQLEYGNRQAHLVMSLDVTERTRYKSQLIESARHTQIILDNVVDTVITIDIEGIIDSANQATLDMFGYEPTELIDQNIKKLMPLKYWEILNNFVEDHVANSGEPIRRKQLEVRGLHKSGEDFPINIAISEIIRDGKKLFVGLIRDLSEHHEAAAKIHHLAYFDHLTGVPNRRQLMDRTTVIARNCDRTGHWAALIFIDLDNFKILNDTWGHEAGDELLVQLAQRLTHELRESDTVARFGGDEFMLLLDNLGLDQDIAASHTDSIAQKLLKQFSIPFKPLGREFVASASLGLTLFNDKNRSIDMLVGEADVAMYAAKAAGRNTYRFFDIELQKAIIDRTELERQMRTGLAAKEFSLHYQPQLNEHYQVTGFEALLRWKHPQRQFVSPNEFIPIAEQCGFILELGHWVLKTACKKIAQFSLSEETANMTVAVNVSVQQFRHAQFVSRVLSALAQAGANPKQLKLELTESILADDVDSLITKMSELKSYGVSFAIDDFGTGYSSLSYLKKLPLDQLKIDQSFVRDVLTDSNDASIVTAIITMGQSLNMEVIAEGVETEGQRDFLVDKGCLLFQGYFFSRPLDEIQLDEYLMSERNVAEPEF